MDATNLEIFALLLGILAFGSSLIHYSAYAKSKAKVDAETQFKKNTF